MALADEIRKSVARVYRKVYIRRRNSANAYEADWFDVTSSIKSFGAVEYKTDDIELHAYTNSTVTLVADNSTKQWMGPEWGRSYFSGYGRIYKTLVKIATGFLDDSGSEVPDASSQALFYGYIADDIEYDGDDECTITVQGIQGVLSEVHPSDYLTASQLYNVSAQTFIQYIRDMTDGAGNYVLQNFISSSAWQITSGVFTYFPGDRYTTGAAGAGTVLTTSIIADYTAWDILTKLAQAEDKIVYINYSGQLVWGDREKSTSTVAWKFFGPGQKDRTYGINIASVKSYNHAWNKIYNRFVVKYGDDPSDETRWATSVQDYRVLDSSSSWIYGEKTYEIENQWINTSAASSVGSFYLTRYSEPQPEITLETKYILGLNLQDDVEVNYYGKVSWHPGSYWNPNTTTSFQTKEDYSFWCNTSTNQHSAFWTGRDGGLYLRRFRGNIIGMKIDMDNLKCEYKIRKR